MKTIEATCDRKMNGLGGYFALLCMAFALMSFSNLSGAAVTGTQGDSCRDLIAGQSIDAGDVCMAVVGDNLEITFSTTNGWELTEAHLWAGSSLAAMPQTKQGNPKIGNFPYNSGDIAGATSHTFSVPLTSFGTEAELCDPNYYAYVAAHAALRKPDGTGGYQNETGWGSGQRIVEKGSWATYYTFQFSCGATPPPSGEKSCETAFAVGDKKLWDILDSNDNPITNRWGWQVTVSSGETLTTPIYAGAAQNDLSKGTYVGDLTVSYSGGQVNVDFDMTNGFTMNETHLYVGASDVQTSAPGQFGHLHEDLGDAVTDGFTINITGDPIYVVAHAVVCSTNW